MLAVLLIMTGCKKEQDFVTLRAVINQTTKSYIGQIGDDRYPFWESNDKIYINDRVYDLRNVDNTYAEVADVESSNDYRAIFPADLVAENTVITGNNTTVPVTLTPYQNYKTFTLNNATHQRVNIPMGAYIPSNSNDNVLRFHNLCSIVRVTIDNNCVSGYEYLEDDGTIHVRSIKIEANGGYLSGAGYATINDDSTDDLIVLDPSLGTCYNFVSLSCENPNTSLVHLGPNDTPVSFDIVVPEFTNKNITITVMTSKGYAEATGTVSLGHSKIASINCEIEELLPLPAQLLPGDEFNKRIKSLCSGTTVTSTATSDNNIRQIEFVVNSSIISTTELQTANSPSKIYGTFNNDSGVLTISTPAEEIYANPNCYQMFMKLRALGSDDNNGSGAKDGNPPINFGGHLNTELVTSMQEMFKECSSLQSFDLSSFSTTRGVTNMYTMFENCTSLTTVTISNPTTTTTTNVLNMGHLFYGCENLTTVPDIRSSSSLRNTQAMFQNCKQLTTLSLTNLNTCGVSTMYAMFRYCHNLQSLDLSTFNTGNVNTMQDMFNECKNLTSLTLGSNFTTANVTNMDNMFRKCENLTSLDLSNFNTSNVVTMAYMFYNCVKMRSITLGTDFTMAAVEANCETYDSHGNLVGRFGHMFENTGKNAGAVIISGTNKKCYVYCTPAIQTFFTNDAEGDFHEQHSNIERNNAKAEYCYFTNYPSSGN